MRKYTTVLFDIDNTLLNFDEDEHNALLKTLAGLSAPTQPWVLERYSQINAELWRKFEKNLVTKEQLKNIRFRTLFEEIGFETDISSREINDRYLEHLGEGGVTVDGAIDVLNSLSKRGYEIDIVTNGVEHTQHSRLKRSGIDKYINKAFVSEKIGIQKPFAGFFNYVFDNISEKDKSKLILIGDSLGSDIKGALDSGIDCIWYNPKKKVNDVCGKPTFEITDIRAVLDILE